MIKLFLFAIVAFAIYFLWAHIQNLKKQADSRLREDIKPMKQCHYCHVYIAQDEAILGADNHWYCRPEHAEKLEK